MRLGWFLVASLALTGCVELIGAAVQNGKEANARDAIQRKDWVTLESICADPSHNTTHVHDTACEALRNHDVDVIVAATCSHKFELMKQKEKAHAGRAAGHDVEVAKAMFACNEGEKFIQEEAASTDELTRLEEAGLPVTQTALALLSKPVSDDLRESQLTGLVRFVVKKRAFGSCAPILANVQSSTTDIRLQVGTYFVAAKCADAIPVFESMLTEHDPQLRANACWSLGEIGGPASIGKLNVVAESDGAFEIVDLNKVYFVRDHCRAAAGKIKLRFASGGGGRVSAR